MPREPQEETGVATVDVGDIKGEAERLSGEGITVGTVLDPIFALRRPVRLQSTTFEPRIDFYNLTNGNTVLNRVTVLGPAYGRASDIQRGRLIKLGIQVEF